MSETGLQRTLGLLRQKLAAAETQKILSNIGWLTVERVLRMAIGFGVGVWVARYLGPTQLGLYSYAIAFTTIFGVIANLGLNRVVVRDLVRFPEQQESILGTSLALKIIAGFVIYFFTFTSSAFLHADNPETHLLVSIVATGIIFQALDPFDFWFQSKTQSKYTVYAKSAAFIMISLVKVLLIVGEYPLTAFAWAGVAEILLTSLGLTVAYFKVNCAAQPFRFCYRTAQQLLRDSSPLILSGIMMMIYFRVDQLMIVRMAGEREAGLYAAAVNLAEAWYFVPLVIIPSTFPNLIESWKTDEAAFYGKLQFLYNLMAAIFYAIALPTTLLAWWIMPFFFGDDFAAAAPMLAMLIWSTFFVSFGTVRNHYLTAMNWAHLHMLTVGAGCAINITLNAIFIPHYGGLAASVTTLVSYGFAVYFSCFLHRRLFRTAKMMTAALGFRWNYRQLLTPNQP